MTQRACIVCGEALVRRIGEKPSKFIKRVTCGIGCRSYVTMRGPRYSIEDRGHGSPCWIWQLYIAPTGYGRLTANKQRWVAHRWYWEQVNGPVPDGLELDHLCRNRSCVNPAHLEPVTREENMRRGLTARLTVEQVAQIKASPLGYRRLAARYGVARGTIAAIRRGRTWRDVEPAS